MCGRFGLFAPPEIVAEEFKLPDLPSFEASYNIAPTEEGPTIGERPDSGERSFSALRWGLIPFWSDGPEDFSSDLINARAETVEEKPAFKKQFRERRCVVPASGFYEWKPS
ncbi:MAG: SOS response-associated peptidase, partial [bacterium]